MSPYSGLARLEPPTDREHSAARRPLVPPRRFALSDLMILVAGSGLGCGWTRANWLASGEHLSLLTWDNWRQTWQLAIQLPTPLLFALGFAALVCRFIPPRPLLEQIARQPGVVALAILSFVFSVHVALLVIGVALGVATADSSADILARVPFLLPDAGELFIYQILGAGPSVLVCWTLQFVMNQREPERSWIDRLGRVLGGCLILIDACWLIEWLTRFE